jgi:hypothetical protein
MPVVAVVSGMSRTSGRSIGRPRPRGLTSLVLFGGALVAYAVAVLCRPQGAVLALLSDDAFYYFKIARNLLAGEGCTFDGIAPTNGFHPLWMLVVIAVSACTGGNELATPVAVLLLAGVIATATLFLIHRTVERHIAPGYGLVAVAAALLPNVLVAMLNGLETGLQLLLATALVGACYRHRLLAPDVSLRRLAALGLLIGLVVLSRLDSVFLVAAAALMTAVASRRLPLSQQLARLLCLGAAFAVVVAPYLAWNVTAFGHLTPSSGVAKSAFPALAARMSLAGDQFWGFLMLVALWAAIAVARAPRGWRRAASGPSGATETPFWSSPVSLLALASALHFLHAFLFMAWGVYWWHFTLYGLGIALASSGALAAVVGARVGLGRIAVAVVSALLIAFAAWAQFRSLPVKGAQHAGWLAAARWAKDHTDEESVFALVDAGLFGYFSHRRVVNLDGKANSYDYLERVDLGNVDAYLESVGVRYVANIRYRYASGKSRIFIPRVNKPSLPLVMDETWEVYRGEPIPSDLPRFGAIPTSSFVIWELPRD